MKIVDIKILHFAILFISLEYILSFDDIKIKSVLNKYENDESKTNTELDFKKTSCHTLIKTILNQKDENNLIANYILSLNKDQIEDKYKLMLNKCINLITNNQIEKIKLVMIIK